MIYRATCVDKVILSNAVSSSILTHSMHNEIACGRSIEETANRAVQALQEQQLHASWFVSAIIIGDAYCENSVIESEIVDGFHKFWDRIGGVEHRVLKEKDAHTRYRIIVNKSSSESESVVLLVTPVSRGLGAAVDKGESLREMLASPTAKRRPNNGILSRFSLSNLHYKTETAMEPELGLLMCSFAKLHKPCSRVLDPCCGSGTLLLAACVKQGS